MDRHARELLEEARLQVKGKGPEEVLRWAYRTFGPKVAFATSLGLEDQVLTDMIARTARRIPIFTLDTGRLFPETYDLIERTCRQYGLHIRVCFPEAARVTRMVEEHGINLFRKSVELRKLCCRVRKVEPLKKALAGLEAWIVGLRSGQAATRSVVKVVDWDEANGLLKISPLADWSLEDVWRYIRARNVPYNPLHDRGFPSIGCACCTRAVRPGEDIRAGRWWWELPEHRECGLHTGQAAREEA